MSILDDDHVLSALQRGAKAAVLASSTPALPIKYMGREFNPPDDQKYLELVFIPNNSSDYWGEEVDYRGLFRLILHWPADDRGAYRGIRVLKSIVEYFMKSRMLFGRDDQTPVKITNPPEFTGLLENGSELLFSSSIRYQSFRQ